MSGQEEIYQRNILEAVKEGQVEIVNNLLKHEDVKKTYDKGETLMHVAARKGDVKILSALESAGGEVNPEDINGKTPLHRAAEFKHIGSVEFLLGKNADVNALCNLGWTPLFFAAFRGSEQIIQMFLDHEACVNVKDIKGDTPLHWGVRGGSTSFERSVKLLLDNGADVNAKNMELIPPLHYAAESGGKKVVKLLLEANAKVNEQCIMGDTALHMAARTNDDTRSGIVDLLLHHDAIKNIKNNAGLRPLDVTREECKNIISLLKTLEDIKLPERIHHVNSDGETELHLAARKGNFEFVKALLMNNAEVDIKNNAGQTPLLIAATEGFLEVVEELAKKSDIDTQDKRCLSPLHRAAGRGHDKVVKHLLSKGAQVNIKDGIGTTPLMWAALHNQTQVMKILLSHCNLNITELSGKTALHYACKYALNDDMVKLLLSNGANANATTERKLTPLHYAACYNSKNVVEVLLNVIEDVNCKDEFGQTPLHFAYQAGRQDTVSLLLEKGADKNMKDDFGRIPTKHMYMGSYPH